MSKKSRAEAFVEEGWDVTVTGRNVLVTDAMKDYAIEKVSKVEKFSNRIIDVAVIMDIQKLDHRVDIILKVNNLKIKSSAASTDMYASIDKAVHKLETQLRRYKTRLQEHHAVGRNEMDMNVNILKVSPEEEVNDEIEDANEKEYFANITPHHIVSTEKRTLKTLTIDEALMKLELSDDLFLIFRSEEDRKLKVIYRRNDGDYGVIEAEL